MAETKDGIGNPWDRSAYRLALIREAVRGLSSKSPTSYLEAEPTPEFIAEKAIRIADAVIARLAGLS